MRRSIAYASFHHLGVIDVDGGDERYPEYDVPDQRGWQWGPELGQGRILLTSYEDTAIEKTVVGDVVTHTWVLDTATGGLREVLVLDRPSRWMTCVGVLAGGERVVVSAIVEGEQRLWLMDLCGGNQRELTRRGEGFHYGVHVSPDERTLSCHVTRGKQAGTLSRKSYPSYSIHTIDIETAERTHIVGHEEHLYFGPVWSPDGRTLAYVDCLYREDPAHFWAALCTANVGSGEHRVVTEAQSHWYGTSYGPAESRGGGSNTTQWSPDGRTLTYTRKLPDSHPDCDYHPERPDHQENVYNPDVARGGTQLCLLDPVSGDVDELTDAEEGKWDFRAAWSPEGDRIAFARARVAEPAELWVMDSDGSNPRFLTRGSEGRGADHPRWVSAGI